ncbi:MAG: DUF512 domain-containing protein [Lachnospiraceae bacterium]|nr:DUF512 domain-containing protein [Lachnospiraceae bacterium]
MSQHRHVITRIVPGSIAEELGLVPGDVLISINGSSVEDIFDYRFLINDEYVEVLVETSEGEELLEIEKDYDEDLGMEFSSGLMDEYRSCRNKCIFCFIDQLPKGMRSTMYFKDDDSRLSFLQGNYITMTNMSDEQIGRIIKYRLEPINISVHTTNPELRCMMLKNRFAGKIMDQLQRLFDAGIVMNAQIVLCRGINDGDELRRTIEDLSSFLPYMESVSVVPVGLSDHREGLFKLEPFTKEDACEVLDIIDHFRDKIYANTGNHFIHASDEWYSLAGRELPDESEYDGYPQLENGVGMSVLLRNEFEEELNRHDGDDRQGHLTVVCGTLIAPFLKDLVSSFNQKFPNIIADVRPIRNDFFGHMITVSGLLTGQDIISQLKEASKNGEELGDRILLPINLLRSGEEVLLDDVTVSDIESALQKKAVIVQSNGQDLVKKLIG